MVKNNSVYVRQTVDFIDSIERYTKEKTFKDFEQDELLQDGVLHKLELIGEALGRLSPDFVKSHPTLPIREAIDTRNRIIHQYDDVDLKIVWDTVTVDLPALKKSLSQTSV